MCMTLNNMQKRKLLFVALRIRQSATLVKLHPVF